MEATTFGYENLTGSRTNNTTMESIGSSFRIFFICIFVATFVVGCIGNGLVIFLTGCRMKTTVNSVWFLNLAIADFILILSSIILPFISYYSHLMFILYILLALSMFASVFFLVVISLDRWLCTRMVVWAQNNRTVLRARITCMIVWVLSISFNVPFLVNLFSAKFLSTYFFSVGFLIPFLIIASSHIAVGVQIKRLKMGKQLRSYRVIIAIVLTFFICCFPFFVCSFFVIKINNWNANNKVLLIAIKFSGYLVFLNSCLNPILYVLMCDQYKKKLKRSLLLVLETAFSEELLIFKGKQIQKDKQNKTTSFELLDM